MLIHLAVKVGGGTAAADQLYLLGFPRAEKQLLQGRENSFPTSTSS